jgi:hypothetical protein
MRLDYSLVCSAQHRHDTPDSQVDEQRHSIPPTPLKETKLRGRSPQANYTDQAPAACRRMLVPTFAGKGCCVVSATNSHCR